MHLVGFPIEIYHDARSHERQKRGWSSIFSLAFSVGLNATQLTVQWVTALFCRRWSGQGVNMIIYLHSFMRLIRYEPINLPSLKLQMHAAKIKTKTHYTGCIKMIGEVSICHYGFQNARRSKFPTWNEIAGVQVLCACAIPLPSSLLVCDVTKR